MKIDPQNPLLHCVKFVTSVRTNHWEEALGHLHSFTCDLASLPREETRRHSRDDDHSDTDGDASPVASPTNRSKPPKHRPEEWSAPGQLIGSLQWVRSVGDTVFTNLVTKNHNIQQATYVLGTLAAVNYSEEFTALAHRQAVTCFGSRSTVVLLPANLRSHHELGNQLARPNSQHSFRQYPGDEDDDSDTEIAVGVTCGDPLREMTELLRGKPSEAVAEQLACQGRFSAAREVAQHSTMHASARLRLALREVHHFLNEARAAKLLRDPNAPDFWRSEEDQREVLQEAARLLISNEYPADLAALFLVLKAHRLSSSISITGAASEVPDEAQFSHKGTVPATFSVTEARRAIACGRRLCLGFLRAAGSILEQAEEAVNSDSEEDNESSSLTNISRLRHELSMWLEFLPEAFADTFEGSPTAPLAASVLHYGIAALATQFAKQLSKERSSYAADLDDMHEILVEFGLSGSFVPHPDVPTGDEWHVQRSTTRIVSAVRATADKLARRGEPEKATAIVDYFDRLLPVLFSSTRSIVAQTQAERESADLERTSKDLQIIACARQLVSGKITVEQLPSDLLAAVGNARVNSSGESSTDISALTQAIERLAVVCSSQGAKAQCRLVASAARCSTVLKVPFETLERSSTERLLSDLLCTSPLGSDVPRANRDVAHELAQLRGAPPAEIARVCAMFLVRRYYSPYLRHRVNALVSECGPARLPADHPRRRKLEGPRGNPGPSSPLEQDVAFLHRHLLEAFGFTGSDALALLTPPAPTEPRSPQKGANDPFAFSFDNPGAAAPAVLTRSDLVDVARLCGASSSGALGTYLLGMMDRAHAALHAADSSSLVSLETEWLHRILLETSIVLLIHAYWAFDVAYDLDDTKGVLARVKRVVDDCLRAQQYGLVVQMLVSIRDFNELGYLMDLLLYNNQLSLLIRCTTQPDSSDLSAYHQDTLRMLLVSYLQQNRETVGDSTDMLSNVYLKFQQFCELGDMCTAKAASTIAALTVQSGVPPEVFSDALQKAEAWYRSAAEAYFQNNSYASASAALNQCRLLQLQRRMGQHRQIIGLEVTQARQVLCDFPNFDDALVLANAYDVARTTDWLEPLYTQCIVRGNLKFMKDFKTKMSVPSSLLADLEACYNREPQKTQAMERAMRQLQSLVNDRDA
eukprot:TRINITY_DN66821_c0_g1_i1.p1 TRINITY_DN66821_c0_g1~~TRINITY_DN66821_c0_g1_i1.p1  ORF type:complete len:1156 (-),score=154.28 TRINITY_DN66821_c0_g1_i1:16-3483(-)